MTERLWRALLAPRDLAALVAFRIALGLLIAVSMARFLAYGWVDTLFVEPTFHFSYWGFSWVPALPSPWIHALFVLVGALGLMVAAGFLYRLSCALLFVGFCWIQLIDVSNYLNHYYLVSLLIGLHLFIPAHRAFSVDAFLRPSLRSQTLPAWCLYLLRFQVAVVYVFAGLAKLNSDWLLDAQPLNIWLSARTSLPLVGPWLGERWVAYLAAWSGFLFDTTVPLWLSLRWTRPFAYVAVLVFHAATSALFPIGMFPVIMVLAALVFFDPSWPRRWIGLLRATWSERPSSVAAPSPASPWRWAALSLALVYCLLQVALPLRTHLYEGNVLWHEQGMRFSWRVMAREKNGSVTFVVRQPSTGREWHVPPHRHLTRLQERELSTQPDLILQLARHIADDFEQRGLGKVQVHADALASLNGRAAAPLIDPRVDLAAEPDGLLAKRWILPAPEGAPVHLRAPRLSAR